MSKVLDRFLRYVKYSTQSDPDSKRTPSSEGQMKFAKALGKELKEIGMSDVSVDENGYVMAFLPATETRKSPVLGFIAHMDTSPDCSGEGVNPSVVEYKGGNIPLNKELGVVITEENTPELKNHIGEQLVVTDGTTLLGADDKAGVAEIMTAMEYLIEHPEIKHGKIAVCFTPDEEIGEGTDHFDIKRFGANYAYTLDGGEIGSIEYENFNAAYAKVAFIGKNFHPGSAKNKMVNAITLSRLFLEMLPAQEVPEHTEGYEGFFHTYTIKGDVERCEVEILIRDFDAEHFNLRKKLLEEAASDLVKKFGPVVELEIRDQYANMLEKIKPVSFVVDIARQAMEDVGIKPKIDPIRGGTDGVRLSYMGLPTPNLFAGGINMHGRYEFVPVNSLEGAVKVVVRIAELFTKL